jgi:hypothetical protein
MVWSFKSTLTGAVRSLLNNDPLVLNYKRFQAVKGGCHSTGALYATVSNNPGRIRVLWEETMLLMVFLGPREPTSEQFNNNSNESINWAHVDRMKIPLSIQKAGQTRKILCTLLLIFRGSSTVLYSWDHIIEPLKASLTRKTPNTEMLNVQGDRHT